MHIRLVSATLATRSIKGCLRKELVRLRFRTSLADDAAFCACSVSSGVWQSATLVWVSFLFASLGSDRRFWVQQQSITADFSERATRSVHASFLKMLSRPCVSGCRGFLEDGHEHCVASSMLTQCLWAEHALTARACPWPRWGHCGEFVGGPEDHSGSSIAE